jgi:membrane-associated phospholipid phosphatase
MDRHSEGLRDAGRLGGGWVLILGAVLAGGLALTGPLAGAVRGPDNGAERWFARHRSGWLTEVADAATLPGETLTALVLGPVLLLVVWLWLRRLDAVAFMALALIGEFVIYLVTVSLVSRQRPPVPILDPGLDPHHSYPSGHVGASVAMYGGLAVLVWVNCGPGRRWLSVVLAAVPLLVAVARLYLGAHHPSDVTASLLFMTAWLGCCAAVLSPRPGGPGRPQPRTSGQSATALDTGRAER